MDLEVAGGAAIRRPGSTPVALTVNGETRVVELEPRVSLLDALREHLCLTGSKKGRDQGTCGACTVWVDGRFVLARLRSPSRARDARSPRSRNSRGPASCIRQVGVAAAIAHAVFHATGRRIRELPMLPELVLDPPVAAG